MCIHWLAIVGLMPGYSLSSFSAISTEKLPHVSLLDIRALFNRKPAVAAVLRNLPRADSLILFDLLRGDMLLVNVD